jgi:hypothetical protein
MLERKYKTNKKAYQLIKNVTNSLSFHQAGRKVLLVEVEFHQTYLPKRREGAFPSIYRGSDSSAPNG